MRATIKLRKTITDLDLIDENSIIPKWTPVGESLPKERGWYLVTDDSGGVRWMEAVYYNPDDGLEPFWSVQNPIAWVSLPEPYKG